ncbi:MAG: SDR family oxidoreductase [Acetobacteraceae bacterium]|nr:SDR family oxidoreductase [Acetobacteraceae bacterium]
MADRLLGKVALVTGGASGIGRAIALRFAREGAIVVIADQSRPSGRGRRADAASILDREGQGGDLPQAPTSPPRPTPRRRSPAPCIVSAGLDVLVTTAAIGWGGRITETTLETWERTLALAVTGVFLASRAAVKQMSGQAEGEDGVRGRILAVGCPTVSVAAPGSAAFAAAKAAVHELARRIARDHGPEGIVCNVIDPGTIMVGRPNEPEAVKAAEHAAARTPWRRPGSPDDVANAALFLASDEASFISGAVLAVDGGLDGH